MNSKVLIDIVILLIFLIDISHNTKKDIKPLMLVSYFVYGPTGPISSGFNIGDISLPFYVV